MGRRNRRDRGLQAEGAVAADAGGVRKSDHAGQAGDKEHIRVPGLSYSSTRHHVHLDVQFEDARQAHQVDSGRRCDSPASLTDFILSARCKAVRSHAIPRS